MRQTDFSTSDFHPQVPDFRGMLGRICDVIRGGRQFLITTHKDPDGDGIGSMLALGKALRNAEKHVVLFTDEPVPSLFDSLRGADKIIQQLPPETIFDAALVLDCAERKRIRGLEGYLDGRMPLINIDHHETNDFFGDLNLVDAKSSSAGELVYALIKTAALPIDGDVAENIFVAIQTDTGSFRYTNTTTTSFKTAAELMEYGVKPWELSRKVMDGYSLSRLKLLEMALGTIEFHYGGEVGVMTLSLEMFDKSQADLADSERFVDFPRFVTGVEIAVLIRQMAKHHYKFSLRSNGRINVARLANRWGGGGHARAAGFETHGSVESVKQAFLDEAGRVLGKASG